MPKPKRFPHDHDTGITKTKIGRILDLDDGLDLDLWGEVSVFGKRLEDQDRFHLHLGAEQIREFVRWLETYRPDLLPKKVTPVPQWRSLDDE